MDVLLRIKQLVVRGQVQFTEKARWEMRLDALTPPRVVSILNARRIDKTIRSRSRFRRHTTEKLYVIKSHDYTGAFIYTKGTIVQKAGHEVFYILVSAKTSD